MSTAISFLSWEGNSTDSIAPRRPSTDDLGGDNKVDDADFPPGPEMIDAIGFNQAVRQIVALARVAAASKLEVRFDGGAPYVARVPATSSNVTASTFTVTDLGAGHTRIVWPANTFPPHACSPSGFTLLSSSAGVVTGHVEEITNGIEVRTFAAGVATDIPWTLHLN